MTVEPDGRCFQRCSCGAWRTVHQGQECWRSSTQPCTDAPPIDPVPRGWPYRKARGAARLFD